MLSVSHQRSSPSIFSAKLSSITLNVSFYFKIVFTMMFAKAIAAFTLTLNKNLLNIVP